MNITSQASIVKIMAILANVVHHHYYHQVLFRYINK
jgi:hypothetical protein